MSSKNRRATKTNRNNAKNIASRANENPIILTTKKIVTTTETTRHIRLSKNSENHEIDLMQSMLEDEPRVRKRKTVLTSHNGGRMTNMHNTEFCKRKNSLATPEIKAKIKQWSESDTDGTDDEGGRRGLISGDDKKNVHLFSSTIITPSHSAAEVNAFGTEHLSLAFQPSTSTMPLEQRTSTTKLQENFKKPRDKKKAKILTLSESDIDDIIRESMALTPQMNLSCVDVSASEITPHKLSAIFETSAEGNATKYEPPRLSTDNSPIIEKMIANHFENVHNMTSPYFTRDSSPNQIATKNPPPNVAEIVSIKSDQNEMKPPQVNAPMRKKTIITPSHSAAEVNAFGTEHLSLAFQPSTSTMALEPRTKRQGNFYVEKPIVKKKAKTLTQSVSDTDDIIRESKALATDVNVTCADFPASGLTPHKFSAIFETSADANASKYEPPRLSTDNSPVIEKMTTNHFENVHNTPPYLTIEIPSPIEIDTKNPPPNVSETVGIKSDQNEMKSPQVKAPNRRKTKKKLETLLEPVGEIEIDGAQSDQNTNGDSAAPVDAPKRRTTRKMVKTNSDPLEKKRKSKPVERKLSYEDASESDAIIETKKSTKNIKSAAKKPVVVESLARRKAQQPQAKKQKKNTELVSTKNNYKPAPATVQAKRQRKQQAISNESLHEIEAPATDFDAEVLNNSVLTNTWIDNSHHVIVYSPTRDKTLKRIDNGKRVVIPKSMIARAIGNPNSGVLTGMTNDCMVINATERLIYSPQQGQEINVKEEMKKGTDILSLLCQRRKSVFILETKSK